MNAPLLVRRLLLIALMATLSVLAEARTFTMQDGSTISGEVASFKNGMIVFAKDGGGKSIYNLNAFSEADQEYLRQQFPQGDSRQEVKGTATAKSSPAKTTGYAPSSDASGGTKPQNASPKPPTSGEGTNNHPGLRTLNVGSVPPKIKGRIQGKAEYLALDDLRGRIVVVHFWSTNVPQSIEELKGLVYLYHKYKDRGFELIGVAMDGSQRRVNDVEEALGVTWPMRLDEDRVTIEEWGVSALPTNVLIDQVGVIKQEHISARDLQYVLAEQLGPLK